MFGKTELSQVYLEVTYREGRPNEKRHKCRRVEPGMILDINKAGKLIGIELTAPTLVTLEAINGLLKEYGLDPLRQSDLAPLLAA